jgi:hypothetical protein
MELPSKENGLDIEGLTVFRKKVHIGLRGPVVDNIAIVAAIGIRPDFAIDEASVVLHFVDLGGLGVRDLNRRNDGILVLAGPASAVDGPFALFHWQPRRTDKIQKPRYIRSFSVRARSSRRHLRAAAREFRRPDRPMRHQRSATHQRHVLLRGLDQVVSDLTSRRYQCWTPAGRTTSKASRQHAA